MTYPFPNYNGATVDVWEWMSHLIPYFIEHAFIYQHHRTLQQVQPYLQPTHHSEKRAL